MQILIIDDHPLFRAGIATILTGWADAAGITETESCEEALELMRGGADFSLILLDLTLVGMNGIEGLSLLRHALPATPIIVLSASEDTDRIQLAIARGAKGYIPKSADSATILSAIKQVMAGEVYLPQSLMQQADMDPAQARAQAPVGTLTPREEQVLLCLTQGMSNKLIADQLDMAENTVRVHVASILKCLQVQNRTEAGYKAARLGLVST